MKKIKILVCLIMIFSCLGMNMSNIFALEEEDYGYLDIDYIPQQRKTQTMYSRNRSIQLPSSYNIEGKQYVTSVKNQNPYGTCWAFSYVAMAESYMITQKGASSHIDLSESQLAYFLYNNRARQLSDPLGNTSGDGVDILGNDYLDLGGNSYFASLWLSGHCGMTNEDIAPYVSSAQRNTYELNNDVAYNHNSVILKNAYFLSDESPTLQDETKQIIYKNGAISAAYYCKDNQYYNDRTASYYCPQKGYTNHAITIVGWDDSYSKDNFKETYQPENNGAWLVKNSWGKYYGNNGFMWISYEDQTLTDFVSAEFDDASVYNHNYHYDGGLGLGYISISSGNKVANIYQVNGNKNGYDELLKAVSFGLDSTDINYSIQIYKDITDVTDPQSGTPALSQPVKGKTTYSGIYTVELNEDVYLKQGENYSIVITFTNYDGSKINVYCDNSANYNDFQTFNKTDYHQSFYISNNYVEDLKSHKSDDSYSVRLKGLTVDTHRKSLKEIQLSSKDKTMYVGENQQLTYHLTPSDAQTQLSWKSDNEKVLTVNDKGKISAIAKGTATITVTDKTGVLDKCLIEVKDVVNATNIQLSKNTLTLNVGNKETLIAHILPNNTTYKNVTWNSSNEKVATVDNGIISANSVGSATITVQTPNGKKATCIVNVTNPITTVSIDSKNSIETKKVMSQKTSLNQAKITIGNAVYTGTVIQPSVKVVLDGKILKNGIDYSYTYTKQTQSNKTISVKIVGKGNYTGTITKALTISKRNVSTLTYAKISNKVYTGKQIKPSITVKYNGKTLKNGTDYTLSYGTNKSTGKATVKITGKGNYTGSITKTFYIVPKVPTGLKISVGKKSATVKYGKSIGASGYQISYRKKGTSAWKSITLTGSSKKITKLTSKKNYEFKVRAYKTIGKTKCYGTYSKIKSIKVK